MTMLMFLMFSSYHLCHISSTCQHANISKLEASAAEAKGEYHELSHKLTVLDRILICTKRHGNLVLD